LKQFVKALDFNGETLRNQSNVPKIVRCQTKARKICWSPKNNKLKLRTLQEKMTEREKKTWQAFREVVEVFLRKNKDPNY